MNVITKCLACGHTSGHPNLTRPCANCGSACRAVRFGAGEPQEEVRAKAAKARKS